MVLIESVVKALLVEDNLEYAGMLQLLLASLNSARIEVTHAVQLEDALRYLGGDSYDVILLDLTLPDSHGFNTFVEICSHAPQVPVVVMTAIDDKRLALRTVREGAQDYVVKGQMEAGQLVRAIQFAIERHRTNEHLRQLSMIDELTGLLNRRGFFSLAKQHIKIAERARRQLLLFYTDVDGLKSINDRFGHHEGDLVLRKVAEILRETFRSSDLIARLGGDEFTILAIDAMKDHAESMLMRLESHLKQENQQNAHYQLSLSTGFARFDPQDASDLDKMLIAADNALYKYKRAKNAPGISQ